MAKEKLGAAKTVKGRIMIMSLVMTLAMILSVVVSIVIQYFQTRNNIESSLRDNLNNAAHIIGNDIDNLTNLISDHAYDYEFTSGTVEQKIAHAKAIASYDPDLTEIIFMNSAGECFGGEMPAEILTKISTSELALTSPESPDGTFYMAKKTDYGNVLCAKMNAKKLSNVLAGSSVDAFLLAKDGTVIATSGSSGNSKYEQYVQQSEEGAVYPSAMTDNGMCYAAAKLASGDNWTLLIRSNTSGFYNGIITVFWVSAGIVVLMVLIGLGANVYFRKTITEPLDKIKNKIVDMSNGVLSGAPVDHNAHDELGVLSDAVNRMADYNNTIISDIKRTAEEIASENLCVKPRGAYSGDFVPVREALENIVESIRAVIENIEETGRQVSSGSEEMSRNSAVLSTAAGEQSITVSQLNDKLNSVYDEISNASASCLQAADTSNECKELVNEGNVKMGDMLDAMNEINSTSSQIANIIKTIQDISEQTNILSINASIEAARVGAAGKGFAVVAGEVGKLADKTAQAAKSTAKLIKSSIESVKNGTIIANETAEMLGKIVEKTDATAKVVENIADASAKQAESVKDVLSGMNVISSEVNQVSESARECADSSEELATQAVMLHNIVDRFVINESKAAKRAVEKPAPAKPAPTASAKPAPTKPAAINLDDNEKKANKPAPAKPAAKPAPTKPAAINLDDNEEKKANKPAATAKPVSAKSAPAKPAAKPTAIHLDEHEEKKAAAPKPAPKPASKPAPKPAPAKPASKPTIKLDDEPSASAAKSSGAPISKATMQPVKRTINLDNNKY